MAGQVRQVDEPKDDGVWVPDPTPDPDFMGPPYPWVFIPLDGGLMQIDYDVP